MGRAPIFLFWAVDAEGITQHTVELQGYELVDFQISGGKRRLLRVFIDKPAGITVDDCALVSHQLTRVYAVEGVDYDRLEVSSPGLDRPLKRAADFTRFAGQRAAIALRLPLNGRKRFTGTLEGLDEAGESLKLRCDVGEFVFRLSDIDKAHLVPDI
ncbi:MAG: ribosome maturation factor RimP [Burkholderiales bacterium]